MTSSLARHCSQCIPVLKSGDLSDPNKWRGIMLMGICSKIFSSIMNRCTFRLLNENGTRFQFGGTPELGCHDRLFVLKTLLTMQKNHSLPSYVAFVDLVKAYDTAKHSLLLEILENILSSSPVCINYWMNPPRSCGRAENRKGSCWITTVSWRLALAGW